LRRSRLRTAFSGKVENAAAAIALHTMYCNFVRVQQTLRVTPAMAAGVSQKLPQYQFIVRQYAIGKRHSVSVMWRGGEVDTIFGF
jgi:hypothetical protein